MKKALVLLLFLAGNNLWALVSVGQSKAEALSAIKKWQAVITVDQGNYIEVASFAKPVKASIVPVKVVFYFNKNNMVYNVVYLLKSAEDRNTIAKELAPLKFSSDKAVSAAENDRYLQMLLSENDLFVFILMDTVVAKRDEPADYAVLKKTVQAWQNLTIPTQPAQNLLGLSLAEVKKLATHQITYNGNSAEGLLVAKGQKVYGYQVEEIQIIFGPTGKVMQAIWVFKNRNEWTRFLSNEGKGADLLLQADAAMQEAFAKGETISYQLDDDTLFRFWMDSYGYGVAFGDKKALKM